MTPAPSVATPAPAAKRVIVWFRRDLRLADNPALVAALRMAPEVVSPGRPAALAHRSAPALLCHTAGRRGMACSVPRPVGAPLTGLRTLYRRRPHARTLRHPAPAQLPVYLWAPEEEGQFQPGRCSRWWLNCSLAALDADLRALGSRLLCFRAPDSRALLTRLAREWGAAAVLFNHL